VCSSKVRDQIAGVRMAKTKPNEDKFKGQVIYWIKEQLKEGGMAEDHRFMGAED